ncbi:MAG: zinc ABC transporter substrate-binding protein, partial [Microthrixaceae bacterium]|nr:zinc ABC transporter substrate-binding protein [Microthrixaceae bacterium]
MPRSLALLGSRAILGLPALALIAAATGCGSSTEGASNDTADDRGITVVATTSILADVLDNTLGDLGTVETLMGPGTDPHDFAP